VVTHQLHVERRTGKVRRSETDVLPLCHATNLWRQTTLTTRLYKVRTNLYPPTYENVPTRLLRRYEKRCKMSKFGWLGAVMGHSRLSAMLQFYRARMIIFSFNTSILHSFQDIASYLSKFTDFNPPHLRLAPPVGWLRSNFVETLRYDTTRDAILTCARKPT